MATKTSIIVISFLLYSVFSFTIQAQEVRLTKSQMYKDFDQFILLIEYNNPHLEIYKKAMGFDVLENIKKIRPEIKKVKDLTGYFCILKQCISLIPEVHARILVLDEDNINEYADSSQCWPVVIPQSELQRTKDSYESIRSKSTEYENKYFNPSYLIYLPVSYINGNYYLISPLEVVNRQDTVRFSSGDMVTGLNKKAIGEFVRENHSKYVDRLRWDLYNRQFYTNFFLWVTNFPRKSFPFTSMTITRKDGKKEVVPLNLQTRFIIEADNFLKINKDSLARYNYKPVAWCKDSLLYIKIPSMSREDLSFYKTEIPRLCKNQGVNNVILDVRGNGGGGDPVWEKILSLLTDQTLYRNQMLGVNHRDICERIPGVDIDSVFTYLDPLLDKQFTIVANESWAAAKPDSNSIQCRGKIYVLHDENTYSAANSLVTFALGCDKVVAVGIPTGYLSGYGVDPFIFQLPESKLLFRMHSVIQIPESSTKEDSYIWNKTEIRVIPTVRYINLFEEYRRYDILYQYDFMNQYDPFFQAVMDDINHKH